MGVLASLRTRLGDAIPVLRTIARFVRYRLMGRIDEQWLRIVMNRSTKELVEQLGPERLDALEISGTRWETLLPFRSFRIASLPEYDVCAGVLDAQFDLIIAEQVFEHLLYPGRAARNVFTMLRPGGYFLINTPFMIRIHGYPVDCTRWTELGLKHFLEEYGFPVDEMVSGSWGNRSCVVGNFESWPPYDKRRSLVNEPDFPLVVWVLARKPVS
jgi:SAM-dependent methyltransferase